MSLKVPNNRSTFYEAKATKPNFNYELELDEGMVVLGVSIESNTTKSPTWPSAGTAKPASAAHALQKLTDGPA